MQPCFFHDPLDEMVAWQNALDIYARGSGEKYLVEIKDSGHMLPNASDAEYMADILAGYVLKGEKPNGDNIMAA